MKESSLQFAGSQGSSLELALQQLKKTQEQAVRDREAVLKQVNLALEQLHMMGFHYRLVAETEERVRETRRRRDKPCPTCGFRTEPPHDLRTHRSHKKPFTDDELAARGMRRVG